MAQHHAPELGRHLAPSPGARCGGVARPFRTVPRIEHLKIIVGACMALNAGRLPAASERGGMGWGFPKTPVLGRAHSSRAGGALSPNLDEHRR